MVLTQTLVAVLCLVGVHSRYVYIEDSPRFLVEEANIYEDALAETAFDFEQPSHIRVARQAKGSMNTNADGSLNVNYKAPLTGNDQNRLTGAVSGTGLKNGGYDTASVGLALDNVNGHGLSLTETHIPKLGHELTAAGRLNVLDTPNHNLNANAFITKTLPTIPNMPDSTKQGGSLDYTFQNRHGLSLSGVHDSLAGDMVKASGRMNLMSTPDHKLDANAFVSRTMPNNFPSFNTHGGSLDYMFRDKVGASVGVSRTPLFDQTDYSAKGNFNLFKDRTSSLDLNAGFSKHVSPYMPSSSWQPSGRVIWTKYW